MAFGPVRGVFTIVDWDAALGERSYVFTLVPLTGLFLRLTEAMWQLYRGFAVSTQRFGYDRVFWNTIGNVTHLLARRFAWLWTPLQAPDHATIFRSLYDHWGCVIFHVSRAPMGGAFVGF